MKSYAIINVFVVIKLQTHHLVFMGTGSEIPLHFLLKFLLEYCLCLPQTRVNRQSIEHSLPRLVNTLNLLLVKLIRKYSRSLELSTHKQKAERYSKVLYIDREIVSLEVINYYLNKLMTDSSNTSVFARGVPFTRYYRI